MRHLVQLTVLVVLALGACSKDDKSAKKEGAAPSGPSCETAAATAGVYFKREYESFDTDGSKEATREFIASAVATCKKAGWPKECLACLTDAKSSEEQARCAVDIKDCPITLAE